MMQHQMHWLGVARALLCCSAQLICPPLSGALLQVGTPDGHVVCYPTVVELRFGTHTPPDLCGEASRH